MGAYVCYDWESQSRDDPFAAANPPPRSASRAFLGDDFFSRVVSVSFHGVDVPVRDADLEPLDSFPSLRSLTLTETQISDAGLQRLGKYAELRSLCLEGTRISDTGLEYLRELTSLERLNLRATVITDVGLAHLKGLTELKWLSLRDTATTDAGLKCLQDLSSLKTLELQGTNISDVGLVLLGELPNLESLSLHGIHRISGRGVKMLRRALPDCRIEFDDEWPTPNDVNDSAVTENRETKESPERLQNSRSGTPGEDDARALKKSSVGGALHATHSRPRLRITSVEKPANKSKPLKISLQLTAEGSTLLTLSRDQFSVHLTPGGKAVSFISNAVFSASAKELFLVEPGRPSNLAFFSSTNRIGESLVFADVPVEDRERWSDLPPGEYVLRVYINGPRIREFDYQWIGQAHSNDYVLVIE